MTEELFVSQTDVDAVAELLSHVSWDSDQPIDMSIGIDDPDDDEVEN